MNRPPPERTPPKFKVGDRVWVDLFKTRYLGTIWKIAAYPTDDLIRMGYAAGFWAYHVNDCAPYESTSFSGNLLELAVIDTLGSLTNTDRRAADDLD